MTTDIMQIVYGLLTIIFVLIAILLTKKENQKLLKDEIEYAKVTISIYDDPDEAIERLEKRLQQKHLLPQPKK